jgi:antitoxin (DNA-binding transcriptional repressor) of toxin-antitoxin stability system
MTTITATDLRTNLDDVMRRVTSGQELLLTHRFYGSIKLSPVKSITKREPLAGMRAIVDRYKDKKPGKAIDYKAEYHKHLEEKYGSARD